MKILQILVLILICVVFTNAQKSGIAGTVVDPQANYLVDVKVTATGRDKKVFEARSGKDGVFRLELSPGEYDVKFEQKGFKNLLFRDIPVEKDTPSFVDAVLEPGNSN